MRIECGEYAEYGFMQCGGEERGTYRYREESDPVERYRSRCPVVFDTSETDKTLAPGSDKNLPQISTIRNLLARGIGVHHGGLLPIVKEVRHCAMASILC